jgi:predicted ATPase/DNA-binding CsgD family transcriptional regulator
MPGSRQLLSHAQSSFVGRSDALHRLSALLERYRLVTVTGPGGVGKTRLAAEVAARVADRFADGVWAVELTAVQDPALVPAAVASALGLQAGSGTSITEALAAHLSRQQVLLVLDNCEHILDAAADLCASLLPAADDIRVLATSREQLGLSDEARYRLAPLSLPAVGQPEEGQPEAVALFIDRVRQFDPELDLGGAARPLVDRLVKRLDGMPLAIELAAARVEALGLAKLLDRLDDRFRPLVSADRSAAARQRSLEATVDWSYRLLAGPEQRVFRFLSVFPGPFTLEAAEAVAGPDAGLGVLRLVDCSLLVPPRPGPDGEARYLMLETLREYGQSRLAAAGEQQAANSALAAYALEVAGQVAAQLETADLEQTAAVWLDAEEAAVHQGLAWAFDHDRELAFRLALALAPWWLLRGRWVQGYALLKQAVDQAATGTPDWYSGQLWLGRLAMENMDVFLGHVNVAADALRDGPPSQLLIQALVWRSVALRNMGQLAQAAADSRIGLDLARRIGYPAGEALALAELSIGALYDERDEEAIDWARQVRLVDLGRAGGVTLRRPTFVLPWVLVSTGHYEGAQELCEEVLARCKAAGDRGGEADMLWLMAQLARETGRLAQAGAHLAASTAIALDGGYLLRLTDILDEGALQCAASGRAAEAATLWSAYRAQIAATGLVDPADQAARREPLVTEVRRALDAQRLRAAEDRGAAMTLTAAVEFAVMMTGADAPAPASAAAAAPSGLLSARERELVALVAQGKTDAEIAEKLFISVSTVRTHLDRIRDKSGYRRRADLTRLALREGIV